MSVENLFEMPEEEYRAFLAERIDALLTEKKLTVETLKFVDLLNLTDAIVLELIKPHFDQMTSEMNEAREFIEQMREQVKANNERSDRMQSIQDNLNSELARTKAIVDSLSQELAQAQSNNGNVTKN